MAILVLAARVALAPIGAAAAPRSVGVVPFERVAAEGSGVPDVAGRLAQRLGTKGLERVVGPAELGAPANAEPAAHEVTGWGASSNVSYLVVGRTTRMGNAISVMARLLDAGTAQTLGTPMVEEASRPDELGRAVESLADQVIARMAQASRVVAPAAAVGARPPAQKKKSSSGSIAIQADTLEVLDGASKKMLFTGHVRAQQEGFEVFSNRLEASYPKGASQPDRMVATGNVRIVEEGRTARCGKAVYFRRERKVVCTQKATVKQKCDRVSGDKITFYLDRDVLKVEGAADVKLDSEDPACGDAS